MYDTADAEAAGRSVTGRPLDEPPSLLRAVPAASAPFLHLAGDGDEDESEQHICRGID